MGGDLQAAQMSTAGLGQPGQYAGDVGTLQGFARGPEQSMPLSLSLDLYTQQALHVELARAQRRAKRQIRRTHQHHELAGRGQLRGGQRRRQQAPFVQARLRLQQFNQRTLGPTATGQHLVESGVTSIHGGQARAAQLTGAPHVAHSAKVRQGTGRRSRGKHGADLNQVK